MNVAMISGLVSDIEQRREGVTVVMVHSVNKIICDGKETKSHDFVPCIFYKRKAQVMNTKLHVGDNLTVYGRVRQQKNGETFLVGVEFKISNCIADTEYRQKDDDEDIDGNIFNYEQ